MGIFIMTSYIVRVLLVLEGIVYNSHLLLLAALILSVGNLITRCAWCIIGP